MRGIYNMAEREKDTEKREGEYCNALRERGGDGRVTVNHCKWMRENRLKHEKWIGKERIGGWG